MAAILNKKKSGGSVICRPAFFVQKKNGKEKGVCSRAKPCYSVKAALSFFNAFFSMRET